MATVLVIDDDPSVRSALRRILKLQSHRVVEAENGSEGLQKYQRVQPELVILDVMMPVKDGFDTIQELLASCPWARVVAITGNQPFLEACRELGAVETIRKPMRDEEVLAAVTAALGPAVREE